MLNALILCVYQVLAYNVPTILTAGRIHERH